MVPPPTKPWRPFAPAAAALAAGLIALVLQRPPPAESASRRLVAPPAALFLRAASLGRTEAAADLLWLRAVQFIGAPGSDAAGYPGLGAWLARITDLAPRFEAPYLTGGILLATVPAQVEAAAALLANAEQRLAGEACAAASGGERAPGDLTPDLSESMCTPQPPVPGCSWEIPLWRGFLAYFGQLDSAAAAQHFCQSVRRGGPSYLTRMSRRLMNEQQDCPRVRSRLGEMLSSSPARARANLLTRDDQLRIVLNCETRALKQASGAFRLRFGREASSAAELVREGLLPAPFVLPGQCWERGDEGWSMRPCRASSP